MAQSKANRLKYLNRKDTKAAREEALKMAHSQNSH